MSDAPVEQRHSVFLWTLGILLFSFSAAAVPVAAVLLSGTGRSTGISVFWLWRISFVLSWAAGTFFAWTRTRARSVVIIAAAVGSLLVVLLPIVFFLMIFILYGPLRFNS